MTLSFTSESLSQAPCYRKAWFAGAVADPIVAMVPDWFGLIKLLGVRTRLGIQLKAVLLPDSWYWRHYKLKNILRRTTELGCRIRMGSWSELEQFSQDTLLTFGDGHQQAMQGETAALYKRRHLWQYPAVVFGERRCEPAFYSRHQRRLSDLYAQLSDEESRQTLLSIIRQRETGDNGFLRLAGCRQYGHPEVQPSQGDIVFDVGAFDGATALMFARAVGAQGRVFACEPDTENIRIMEEKISRTEYRNSITIVPYALSEIEGAGLFKGREGGLSRLLSAQAGMGSSVRLITLDNVVREYGLTHVDLVKLDTEGHEWPVLKGARDTLLRYRPKLQISVYHRQPDREDLVDIPDWLRDLGYRGSYYLGHHAMYWSETILYVKPAVSG